ncbi:MAG: N-formylglutamate amidohydrolase [Phycisphaerales bacterium]|nr:N-formylglutamate amidohydrolase [Phycisphaerales bacterium]
MPPPYAAIFSGAEAALESHRGYDIGALGVAHRMASRLARPIIFSTVTRLLIDLNRSLDHPDLFSQYALRLHDEDRTRVIDALYTPYRESVSRVIESAITAGHRVLHVGVHSCTDELDGARRDLDISFLFDPSRLSELAICERWRAQLLNAVGDIRSPFNEPYLGTDDGLTTTLRSHFPVASYAGIEIEVRQGMIPGVAEQQTVGELLASTSCSIHA